MDALYQLSYCGIVDKDPSSTIFVVARSVGFTVGFTAASALLTRAQKLSKLSLYLFVYRLVG